MDSAANYSRFTKETKIYDRAITEIDMPAFERFFLDDGQARRSDGPYNTAALGDLPNLIAGQDGTVTIPTLAPRLEVQDVRGRSLVIHAGADRYGQGHAGHHHDHGSDSRVACGIIP